MGVKTVAGKNISVDNEGYMTNLDEWTEEIAHAMSIEDGIELTDKHFEVIYFLQDQYRKDETLTMRKIGKSGITDIKGLYKLFPGGPLKYSSKYAGIPKPLNCV